MIADDQTPPMRAPTFSLRAPEMPAEGAVEETPGGRMLL